MTDFNERAATMVAAVEPFEWHRADDPGREHGYDFEFPELALHVGVPAATVDEAREKMVAMLLARLAEDAEKAA